MKHRISSKLIISLCLWIGIIVLFELLFQKNLVNTAFVSAPSRIVQRFFDPIFWGMFGQDILASLSRLIISIVLGYLLAQLVILGAYFSSIWKTWVFQLHALLKYLPAPVLIPLSILIFGINDLAMMGVVTFCVFVLYTSYSIDILRKEVGNFQTLHKSWNLTPWTLFRSFQLPVSTYLSYRTIPGIIVWGLGVMIIVEMIVGGKTGLGVRLIQFQQLYATSSLYGYILLILILAVALEKIWIAAFSRYIFDWQKIVSSVILGVLIVGSFGYQASIWVTSFVQANQIVATSYNAVINLPLFVYVEKHNTLNIRLQVVGSGLQAVDSLVAGKTQIAGFGDMPNALQAIQENNDLKIVSQVVEQPTRPVMYFVTSKAVENEDFSNLNNTTLGYYPNNPIIQKGLEFVLLTKKADPQSISFLSGNDPTTLNQSFTAGKIQGLAGIEPYVTDLEEKFGAVRLNTNETMIKGLYFENLPLAGVVIDTKKLNSDQIEKLQGGMVDSLEFIRSNTDEQFRAKGELRQIMEKYSLNPNARLPQWQAGEEMQYRDTLLIVDLMNIYQAAGFKAIDPKNVEGYYLN